MSQGHPFPPRAGFSTKLPDRTASALHTQPAPFGQSAPTFPRRTETNYGYSNAAPQPQAQYQAGPSNYKTFPEKESNVLQELSDEQKAEINEAVRHLIISNRIIWTFADVLVHTLRR